jgi:chemotaxis protein methyltransferase CheR
MTNPLFESIRQSLNRNIGFNLNYLDDNLISEAITSFRGSVTDSDLVYRVKEGDLNDETYQKFLDKILNHESYFFRHFSTIDKIIIPELIQNSGNSIDVWSAGCSSGEEIYSIAISLDRHKDDTLPNQNINLLGTDINKNIIERAKLGIYKNWSLRGKVPFDFNLYFNKINENYHLKNEIKSKVNFSNRNILSSKELKTKFDLILCRNVIIYFDTKYIPDVINNLYERMEDHTRLIVGHSENSDFFKEKFKLEIVNDVVTFKKKIARIPKVNVEITEEKDEPYSERFRLNKAFKLFKQLKYKEAMDILDNLLVKKYDFFEAQLLKSIIQLNSGNTAMAKMLLNSLVRQYPNEGDIYYFLGLVLKEESNFEAAILKFKEGLDKKNDNILCLLELKFLYEKLKDINAVQFCINRINKILEKSDLKNEISKYSDITYYDIKTMIS